MNPRLTKLKKLLADKSLDAALISSVPNIIYLTNFSYFSNEERDGYLLLTKNNHYLITSPLYSHAAKKHVKDYIIMETGKGKGFSDLIKEIIKKEHIKSLGIKTDNITVREQQQIADQKIKMTHFDLSQLRIIKDTKEITEIKKTCQLGDKAFTFILKKIREGKSEKDIAFELEFFIRKHGGELAFPSIVAFQENAAIPHHLTSDRKLKKNEFILIDFGVKYENYCSDMTRTIFLGKPNDEQKKVYETVKTAQTKAIYYIQKKLNNNENAIATNIDSAARDYVTSLGFPPFLHSSHGIGLEVHENPHISSSKDKLENGMVFSIEPGIYLPDKFGVRIEDIFVIENNNLIQLTKSPKNLIEIS